MQNQAKFSVVLALACLLLWPMAAEAKWRTFTSPAGDFSTLMPATPKLSQSVHKSFVGAVKENTYTAQSGGVTYSASYSELPGIAVTLGGSHTIFKKAKEGLLKEAGGTETSFNEVSLGSSEGRELNFTTSAGIGKARFFLIDKRLYVIVASGPNGAAAAMSRFLNSFKLLS